MDAISNSSGTSPRKQVDVNCHRSQRDSRSSRTSPMKQIGVNCDRSPRDSLEFLLSHLSGRREVLEEYLESNYVPRNILNVCLLEGLRSLIRRNRENHTQHIAQSLELFLELGATWHPNPSFENWMKPYLNVVTPAHMLRYRKMSYHMISKLPGDHHELLDLMIEPVGQALLQRRGSRFNKAIVNAVRFKNIGCVRTLLMNGAHPFPCFQSFFEISNIVTGKIPPKPHLIIRSDILNDLVSSEIDVNEQYSCEKVSPLMYAAATGSIESVRTLIQKKARFDLTDINGNTVWKWAVFSGNVDVFKCLSERNSSYDEDIVLFEAVSYDHKELVRYLLHKDNTVRKLKQDAKQNLDLCMKAVSNGSLSMVQLLDEKGFDSFQTFGVLKQAVIRSGPDRPSIMDVLEYLLCKYSYPLNHLYMYHNRSTTLLTEAFERRSSCVVEVLLKHGADPNIHVNNCHNNGYTAIHYSIACRHRYTADLVACLIRNGANLSIRSYDMLPFEAAVLNHNHCAAEMLLLSGCPCGVYSTPSKLVDAYDTRSKMGNLMNSWGVRENRVKSLRIMCRTAILNHFSRRTADQKLVDLPLPSCLIRFLGIPELDDIIDANK